MDIHKSKLLNFGEVIDNSNKQIAAFKEERDSGTTNTARNLVTIATVIVGGFLALSIITQVLMGMVALFASVMFGVASFFIIKHVGKLDKLVAQKIKNKVLNMRIKEAQVNSLVQLKNSLLQRKEHVAESIQANARMGGKLELMRKELREADDANPYIDKMHKVVQRIEGAYTANTERIHRAKRGVTDFEQKVGYYEQMAAMTKIAREAMAFVSDDELDEMLSLESFKAIDDDFCSVMAEMDAAIEFDY